MRFGSLIETGGKFVHIFTDHWNSGSLVQCGDFCAAIFPFRIIIKRGSQANVLFDLKALEICLGTIRESCASISHDWPDIRFVYVNLSSLFNRVGSFEETEEGASHGLSFADDFLNMVFKRESLIQLHSQISD